MGRIKASQMNNLMLSFGEVWKFDKRLIFVLILNVFVSALRPFPNIIFAGRIVDVITNGKDFMQVVFYIALMFGMDYALTAASTFLAKFRDYLFIKVVNKLDSDVIRKCLNMDYEKFNDSSVQERIALVNQAVCGNNFFTSLNNFFQIISQIISLIGIVWVMTILNAWLLEVALIVIVSQGVLHYIRLKHDRNYTKDSIEDNRKIFMYHSWQKTYQTKKILSLLAWAAI